MEAEFCQMSSQKSQPVKIAIGRPEELQRHRGGVKRPKAQQLQVRASCNYGD